jgi:hypothetical protein
LRLQSGDRRREAGGLGTVRKRTVFLRGEGSHPSQSGDAVETAETIEPGVVANPINEALPLSSASVLMRDRAAAGPAGAARLEDEGKESVPVIEPGGF